MFVDHSSNECSEKEVVDIDKKFNCLWLCFSQTIDVSYCNKINKMPIETFALEI